MNRQTLRFVAPRQVELVTEPLPSLPDDRLLIETVVSAISAGTEMLVYRGQMPASMESDATIEALSGALAYPLKYGYAAVGRVIDAGRHVDPAWLGRMVFAFNPHESHFIAAAAAVTPIDAIPAAHAALLPNLETAVSFAMDGAPTIGERVLVLGLGVVGLLTTALLSRFPLAALHVADPIGARRELGLACGAGRAAADPPAGDYDLIYEVSGAPAALDAAVAAAGYASRIVIGSWYGRKPVTLDLGGPFHRNHVQLIGSQVSTLAPRWRGRWTKDRRWALAREWLPSLPLAPLITHQIPFADAASAYQLLDTAPDEAVQVLLRYD